jgi:hypothetical protein
MYYSTLLKFLEYHKKGLSHLVNKKHEKLVLYLPYLGPLGACTIKVFTAVIYGFSRKARVFVPGKPLQPCLMFVVKAGAYLREAPFRWSTLGRPLALPTNIRLGWRGLPGTNTLAC